MPCNRKLGRHERITKQFEYQAVISKGKMLAGKRFKAYLLVDGTLSRKAGFIAGRGVGIAARRNRARRLLREAYRLLKPSSAPRGFRAVFVASRGINGAALGEIQTDMREMLESCNLVSERGADRGGQ